ncbi:MAG TPA: carbon-nitrogen hydrolase family protein [Candidatus Polarisedimenticolaceae bacterium]|nr:carbon-nitrogen hydrolase family protein [Candidatus Polarisedimenticolaceae bacterium]
MARPAPAWKTAAIQMTSTADVGRNLDLAERLVRGASAAGARLVALPENFAFLRREGAAPAYREPLDGPLVARMSRLARELGCYLLLGSFPEAVARRRRVHNTSVLLGPRGGPPLAVYRKLHLFDIDIPGGAVLQESRQVAPGDRPVVVDTPLGRLGLSICYDLRFPELYRRMALDGAQVLFVPAAFTAFTGPHHWLPLLRARAIENQCWVVAPAQVGQHNPQRRSHGEAAIIDPWGKVVASKPRGQGWVLATIDLALLSRIRRGLPCLAHTRRELLGSRRSRRF